MANPPYPVDEGLQVHNWQTSPLIPFEEVPKYYVEPTYDPEPRYDTETAYNIEPKQDDYQPTPSSTILGLKERTFWIVIIAVLVVAAVVGGVCGSVVAKNRSTEHNRATTSQTTSVGSTTASSTTSSSSTSTTASTTASSSTSTTSTASASTASSTSALLTLDCPAINDSLYSTVLSGSAVNSTFEIFCDTNYVTSSDLAVTSALTIDECMDDCAKQNEGLGGCKGIVFNRNLTLIASLKLAGNCFLKADVSDVSVASTRTGEGAAASLVSTS